MSTDNIKRLTIREWAEDDRPREKMLRKGANSLSDSELLAILLGSGNMNESAVELARRVMRDMHDNINELAQLTIADLCKKYKGIGTAKAVTIVAALELGKRRKTSEVLERKAILSSRDFFELFEPYLIDLPHEEFWIALLNNANKVIEVRCLTKGGFNQSIVDVPMVLKLALEKSALAIGIAHNHPSGNCTASSSDKEVTTKIKRGCEAIGIRLLDHVIVARGTYLSFADEGWI